MLKKCSCCKVVMDESKFNWKFKNVKRSYNCRTCSRNYLKSHYQRNHQYYLLKAKRRNLIIGEATHQYLGDYLRSHPCVDCGETDILVLEFDHIDRKNKLESVATMVRLDVAMEKLKHEISKCEVRCANCHRRKTEIENNSWKIKFAPVA